MTGPVIERPTQTPTQTPSIGRIVHVVLADRYGEKTITRPGIIVRVWNDEMLNLQVLTDGSNDGLGRESGILWCTSVHYSEQDQPYTWHWPPRP